MDGPAFYSAREAIRIAAERTGHSIAFRSSVLNETEVNELDMMLQSLSVIRKLWTDKFLKVLSLLREGITQRELALKLGTTQPSVSKLLRNACWDEVLELQKLTSGFLKRSLEKSLYSKDNL